MPAVYDSEEEDESYVGSYTPSGRPSRQRSTSIAIRSLRGVATRSASEATPLGSDDDDEDEDDNDESGEDDEDEEGEDDEPAEIDDDDLDPINSGQATPALSESIRKSKAINFHKKKETKTIKGQTYTIVNDELILEDDPRGEAKIDALGSLLGGREWKIKTFTSSMRPNPKKLYMLSIDAARAAGFRDSLYFFRKNPLVHKLAVNQPEKDRLIAEGKLGVNLKSRTVTMVSARNVFKVMGALFVKNGKYVFDDYYEDKALAAGHQPGEPAWVEGFDTAETAEATASAGASTPAAAGAAASALNAAPKSRPPPPPRDEYISITGGHTTFGGTGLQPFAKTWDPTAKKARPAAHLSLETWMHEYAKAIRRNNLELGNIRRGNVGQVQLNPSGVGEREQDAWIEVEEDVPSDEETEEDRSRGVKRRRTVKAYNPIRGIYEQETNVPHVWSETQATKCRIEQVDRSPYLWSEEERADPKKRRIEEEAAKMGIATIEFVVDEEVAGQRREELVAGMWDFRSIIAAELAADGKANAGARRA